MPSVMRYKFYNLKVDLNRTEKENYGQQSEKKLRLTLTAIENRSFGSCNFIERKAPRSDCNSCVKQSNKDNIYNVSLFSCSQQNSASFANHRCLGVGFEGETKGNKPPFQQTTLQLHKKPFVQILQKEKNNQH